MSTSAHRLLLVIIICISAGCANVTAPTGGKKDITPPKLTYLAPGDSLKNTRVTRIELDFDEYITLSDVSKEIEISPILSIQPVVTSASKHVVVKIIDSLLEENTTYRMSFGKAIKDLHEGNPFSNYTYTFSTGPYFDSLQLKGKVIDAASGLPDSTGVLVELYSAKENDSAVVRKKPRYITKADGKGEFVFKGLPGRTFRIYALKDPNGNMVYDGPASGEMIGFIDRIISPADSTQPPLVLKTFLEAADTSGNKQEERKKADSLKGGIGLRSRTKPTVGGDVAYSLNLDTTNAAKRTFDITHPINLLFNKTSQLNNDKITLAYDSAEVSISQPIAIVTDTARPLVTHIYPVSGRDMAWREDKVYTLRLAKGFAKDTAGKDLMPSKYVFRSFEDADYGKINLHLPGKYDDVHFLLMATTDKDTVYIKPVKDTLVRLTRLKAGRYSFRIIADKNGNGKWDTGDLFAKVQPEEVIPYRETLNLKAGWEHDIDFEQKPTDKKGGPVNRMKDK